MSETRITIVVENTATAAGRGLLAEHGLAYWIETAGGNLLFDTGQGNALEHNARCLGIDLASVEAVALSHGHYDHTGGLWKVLQSASIPCVYVHPAAFNAKFVRGPAGAGRSIGMPGFNSHLLKEHADVIPVEAPKEIARGVHLTGPIPRTTRYEDIGGTFYTDAACTQPDELVDDQAVYIETAAGTAVILGCGHAGVINTLHYVRQLTGGRLIVALIGGMHLVNAGEYRIDRTVEELHRFNIPRLLPCHCTGFQATARLCAEFPGQCEPCTTGAIIDLEDRPV